MGWHLWETTLRAALGPPGDRNDIVEFLHQMMACPGLFKQACWQFASRLDVEVAREWSPAYEHGLFALAVRADPELRMVPMTAVAADSVDSAVDRRLMRYWMAGHRAFGVTSSVAFVRRIR